MPLISGDNIFAISALVMAGAAFAAWSEKTRLGRKMSGVMVALLAAMILGSLGAIPNTSAVYDSVLEWIVPLAIPLLLFDTNLRRIFREAGRMAVAFLIGTVGTLLGAWVGVKLVDLGDSAPQLAGVFSATYIGGGMNFVAVAQATGFNDGSQMTASVAADNLITAVYLIGVMSLPAWSWLGRVIPATIATRAPRLATEATNPLESPPPTSFKVFNIAAALALALTIAGGGQWLAASIGLPDFGILFITILALIPGNLAPRAIKHLEGHSELGILGVYVFLFVLGAMADLRTVFTAALPITIFALIIVVVHLITILLIGGLLRFDLAELIIASNACVGGSSSAGPLAAARGWPELATPGILCGALGNAIGTFLGMGAAHWLS